MRSSSARTESIMSLTPHGLKISHWIQTENTYGDTTAKTNDKAHEYELEYRLTAEMQISPKLGGTHAD